MKLYNILLLFCFALLLTSCLTEPPKISYDDFLCVINADGTGFQKFAYPNVHGAIWDMYVTKDGKLIFAADKYYITEPDSINPIAFTDNLSNYAQKLTLSYNNQGYYCNNGDLYQFDFQSHIQKNLTINFEDYLVNPTISNNDSIITLCQKIETENSPRFLCNFNLSNGSLIQVPNTGNSINNGIYDRHDNKLFYEQDDGLYKIDLNGTNNINLIHYMSYLNKVFTLTNLSDHIVSIDNLGLLKIFNIQYNTLVTQQVNLQNWVLPKIPKNESSVFYVSDGNIYSIDLINNVTRKIPNTSGVELAMCPSWDGDKIFYFARLRSNK